MDFTLKQLQVFLALAQYGNMGIASDRLFMSKGAVSQSLQELERILGVQLFDRVHPRMYLNHDGERLLPLADELLSRAVDVNLIFSEAPTEHFLRVGSSKTIGDYLLPKIVAVFEETELWLPEVRIRNSKKLCEMLIAFNLDVALLEGEERDPKLVFEPWVTDQMVIIAAKDKPRYQQFEEGSLYAVQKVDKQRWILREQDSGSRGYFEQHLAPKFSDYHVALTLDSPEGILSAVAEGLGLAFVSRLTAKQSWFSGRFKIVDLDEEFTRQFSLCYHPKKHKSAGMQLFLSYCRGFKAEI